MTPLELARFEFDGETLVVLQRAYVDNDRVAITLAAANGSPYTTVSTNIPEAPIGETEFAVQAWNIRKPLLAALLGTGLFEETGHGFRTGHVVAPVWRLNEMN